jgi:hypothetical protein
MVKGFIFFKEGKIPFVIENYRMELFTDDSLLNEFSKEYNFKENYILLGQYFGSGIQGQKATFFVERSMGSTCYLRCYIINMLTSEDGYDTIGLQSPFLDDIFRYKYKYLDMVRTGSNLAVEPKDAYKVPFSMNGRLYELTFRIGHDNRLGLLEDFDRKGELLLPLQTDAIQECYDISVVLYRLSMFMMSNAEVPFNRITLYKKGFKVGWFFSSLVLGEAFSGHDGFFHELDVLKYVPKILNNIALDSGNKITQSIPLGHLGNFDSMFSPQRFVEQVMAFEYLFDKLDHKKAQNSNFTLKKELAYMFNEFPQLLSGPTLSSDKVSEQIKEIRRTIAHGYAYYYDFKNDSNTQHLILLLDKLLRNMSLLWIGFTKDEIAEYPLY